MTLKLRWKLPDSDTSTMIELPVIDADAALDEPSTELRFAASVAAFGMLLRDSPYRGDVDWDLISALARSGRGDDPKGYRAEFGRLVDTARAIAGD
jgi:Ca-activated chloride channel family protein